jgi:phosphoglycolate phosphatase
MIGGLGKRVATLLFDFDGTLADSLTTLVAITNRLAPQFGYRPTDPANLETLRGMNARQIIRQSQISVFKIPALLRRVRVELRQECAHIPPFPGIPETVGELRAQRHTLGIVTSNAPANVRAFLAAQGLTTAFFTVVGGGTLFGKGRLIRRVVQHHGLDLQRTIYVGDETRDIEAARFAGLAVAAVTWGFNDRDRLRAAQPDWIVETPVALRAIADAL